MKVPKVSFLNQQYLIQRLNPAVIDRGCISKVKTQMSGDMQRKENEQKL